LIIDLILLPPAGVNALNNTVAIDLDQIESTETSASYPEIFMTTTGLAVFDKTLQETNIWIKQLMECLGTDDRELAYTCLKATLHALRDLLGPENAAHLAAQLPLLLRGVYYEGWHIAGTPSKERHKEAFFEHVRLGMPGLPDCDTELVVRSVFEVMWDRIDQGEIAKLIRIFPRDLRQLWTGAEAQD
jgi:uncharacterized protein (DUF2267 family)